MKSIIKKGLFATLMISSLIPISCEKRDKIDLPDDPVKTTEVYQKEVIDSANLFAFDLFKPVLADAKETDNIMISPFSISSALSMTLNGAAGETFMAMRKTLKLEGNTLDQINDTYLKLMTEMGLVDTSVIMDIANSIWVEKRFIVKQPFITDLQTWYKAEARGINVTDPDAVNIINGWIAEKTHDKITNMLDKLDLGLEMLLINAVYFNGKWRYPFDKTYTKEGPFYITPTVPKTVPMMHQTVSLKAARSNNLTLVEIPYGKGNYTMVVVLPDENVNIRDFSNSLTTSLWQQWMRLLANNYYMVDLSMPRFNYKYNRRLNDDLEALGMGIAFTEKADFSNISDQGLMISSVLHQSFINTNEEGTEAAAATVVEFITTGTPVVIKININHPFLYFIRESSTSTILFMGRVSDPTIN